MLLDLGNNYPFFNLFAVSQTLHPEPPRLFVVRDRLGRPLRDLRISVTDRCNFRCRYCMPRERFGEEGRRLIENIFSSEIINKQTMDLYKSLFRKNEYN